MLSIANNVGVSIAKELNSRLSPFGCFRMAFELTSKNSLELVSRAIQYYICILFDFWEKRPGTDGVIQFYSRYTVDSIRHPERTVLYSLQLIELSRKEKV